MQIIAVDIGNSSIKVGVESDLGQLERMRCNEIDDVAGLPLPIETCFWSICSVNQSKTDRLADWVKSNRSNDRLHVLQANDIPLESNVDNRHTIGRDRLVAAWMATQLANPGEDLVVVDAGTAVTIDHIDKAGVFQGGVIFPGASSCLKILAQATHDLPELSHSERLDAIMSEVIGKDTELAILRGVYQSQLDAIREITRKISRNGKVFATGGEIELLQEYLQGHWRVEPLLVLTGAHHLGKKIANG